MRPFRFFSLLSVSLLFLIPIFAHAAEIRLAVAPRITLPKDAPFYAEETSSFYGTTIYILNSQQLRSRVEKQLGQKIPASLQVTVTQIPKTSILSITATGVDDSVATPFLSALVDQFLKAMRERKKKWYDQAIQNADSVLASAPKEIVPQIKAYHDQLVASSLLDTGDVFEISEF